MQYKKAHFIGIGGVGMSATAKLLKDLGVEVSGSDEAVYPPMSDFLQSNGLPYTTPYQASNIPQDADLIVIGKNAKLVPESNAEVAAAYASSKAIKSFPDLLNELSAGKETLVVAGSYGKSTSSALMAHTLEVAGKEPSYFIGASPLTPQTSARMGQGSVFVMEGDEYPASNTDLRSKFLLMNPSHVLVTPLAHDHFNVFPTPQDYLRPFYGLAAMLPPQGTMVVCTEGALSKEFLSKINRPAVTYGLNKGDYTARNVRWGERTQFELCRGETVLAELETTQLGEHNVQNIVGVATLLIERGLVTTESLQQAVASFRGVRRRLDRKSLKTSIPIFEGFGSSFEKLQSAIAAMRLHFPDRRLIVVFEPNTIGWRSRSALAQYDEAFRGAGKVYIFNPPHDGKQTELSLDDIVGRARAANVDAYGVSKAQEVLTALQAVLSKDDCILLSSSGAMGGLTESVPLICEQKFPA